MSVGGVRCSLPRARPARPHRRAGAAPAPRHLVICIARPPTPRPIDWIRRCRRSLWRSSTNPEPPIPDHPTVGRGLSGNGPEPRSHRHLRARCGHVADLLRERQHASPSRAPRSRLPRCASTRACSSARPCCPRNRAAVRFRTRTDPALQKYGESRGYEAAAQRAAVDVATRVNARLSGLSADEIAGVTAADKTAAAEFTVVAPPGTASGADADADAAAQPPAPPPVPDGGANGAASAARRWLPDHRRVGLQQGFGLSGCGKPPQRSAGEHRPTSRMWCVP